VQPGPSAAVDYTISADHTGGHAAHAELGFARLAGNPGNPGNPTEGSRHALQDYQMQLMLLEQQGKKRMMMAQQTQRVEDLGVGRPLSVHPLLDSDTAEEEELELSGVSESEAGVSMSDPAAAATIPEACAPDAPDEPDASDDANPRCTILYRVRCFARHRKCDGQLYGDRPESTMLDDHLHLARGRPVFNDSASPSAFSVYRTVDCQSSVGASFDHHHPPPYPIGPHIPRETIAVDSPQLRATLQRISTFAPDYHSYMPEPPLSRDGPLPVPSVPLSNAASEYSHYFFYHHREALRHAAAADPCDGDLQALCSYLRDHPDPMFSKCDELLELGQVSAETLSWVFRPNEVVVAKKGSLDIAYMLRSPPRGGASDLLQLRCWNWGYDGKSLLRKDKSVSVTAPTFGTVAITQLSAYPLRYATDATKQRLLDRGSRFWALRHPSHVSYEGPDYRGERVYPWDSRCMIDYETYRKFHPAADAFYFTRCGVVSFDKWPHAIRATTAELSETDTMLLPPEIHGFFLKDKRWVRLLVNNIAPITWNKEAYDRLVLPQRVKNMVKALVLARKEDAADSPAKPRPKAKRSDLIRGKGDGLIMLLHGGPGTGKTLTAESVAELAEMPLYNVTCGDVGTKAEAVENYLNSVLHLGQKWNCVLLLDEADVFLEQRSLSDLKRNSLVSVFLRTLEYYSGILLLTSNRVGTFDAAFKSRIQVALHYPPLDRPSRRAIWANFFDMLRADSDPPAPSASAPDDDQGQESGDDGLDYDAIAPRLDELAAREMNGRQIRNVVATARQLAQFEGVRMGWEHVEVAICAAADFDGHLRRVGAMGEEDGWIMDGGSVVENGVALEGLGF